MKRETRLRPAFLFALAPLAAWGCESEGQALIPVDIARGTLEGIVSVDIAVTEGEASGREVRRQRFPWQADAGAPLQVGVYLPDGYSGSVGVQAQALSASTVIIGVSNRVDVVATAGQRAQLVELRLVPGTGPGDGGSHDGGGRDGGADRSTDGLVPDGGPASDARDTAAPDAPADAPPVVESRAWTAGSDIEQDLLQASYTPDIAIDNMGHVLVAWREGAGVKVRRQDGTTRSWGAVQTIENRGTTDAVQVAMGQGGRALVVWYMRTSEVTADLQGLWARHSSDSGQSWSDPVRVHEGPVFYDIALAMSPGGIGRLAWQESSNNINTLWSAHFNPGTSAFTGVGPVRAASDADERYPRIALASDGGGLLAWIQDDDDGQDSIWGADIASGAVGTPELLDSYTADSAGEVDVAIASDGSRGMAVWQQRNGSTSADLYYNPWSNGQGGSGGRGWGGPLRVLSADWVSSPAVVMDRNGQATVAFTQPIIGYKWNVIQIRFTPAGGWGLPLPLETTNQAGGDTREDPIPHLGIDDAGNVHAVWRRKTDSLPPEDSASNVVVRRYAASTMTWDPEVVLGAVPALKAYHPEIAVAPEGRAAATFYFLDPTGTGSASSFNVFAAFFR